MKKRLLLVLVLLVGIFSLTGCKEKEIKFKNAKTFSVNGEKGIISVQYDDDGTYELIDDGKVLKNTEGNFRYSFEFGKNKIEQQEKIKEAMKKRESYYIEDVEYGGYKGYIVVDKNYASTQVILYADTGNDTILLLKISPVQSLEANKKIKEGVEPKDVLFNQEKVQKSLKTIKYKNNMN